MLCISCATPRMKVENFSASSEQGLIFGTISFPKEKPRFDGYFPSIIYTSDSKEEVKKNSNELHIKPNLTSGKHDGELLGGKTYLFVLNKEPGNYKIAGVRLALVGVGGHVSGDIIKDFEIPFEVKKGEITYIGDISINEYAFGKDTIIKLSDKFDRDLDAIKHRKSSIDWSAAKKSGLIINY